MNTLLKPDKKLAWRLLTEVGFDDRITGYKMGKRTGAQPITMYSFQEVAGFLSETYPNIDLNKLEKWIDTVMGDQELAGMIREVIKNNQNNRQKITNIRDLVTYRLIQCKKMI